MQGFIILAIIGTEKFYPAISKCDKNTVDPDQLASDKAI